MHIHVHENLGRDHVLKKIGGGGEYQSSMLFTFDNEIGRETLSYLSPYQLSIVYIS